MVQIKKQISILLFTCFSLSLAAQQKAGKESDTQPKLYQPSIVLEMFSSEGCSSCPFADEFMGELIDMSDSANLPVYVVDFHVDIWNRSGWVDPWSDSNYTQRQQTYLKKNGLTATYTPMVFINGGAKDYAGTDKASIGRKLHELINTPSKHFLRTGAAPIEGQDSLTFVYTSWGDIDSCEIRVAFVQKNINNMVTAGENKDRILHHHNLVRGFYTAPMTGNKGTFKIPYNPDFNMENFALVSYIQHKGTWRILASDRITFKME